jgi:hypothetical protein
MHQTVDGQRTPSLARGSEGIRNWSAGAGPDFQHRLPGQLLPSIGGLCGVDDTILIDSDSQHLRATRYTASQVVAFRHNSPESLRKKLERLPAGSNRLVVVEGLYSTGRRGAARESSRCAPPWARLLLAEAIARHLRPTGLGWPEDQMSHQWTSSSAPSRRWPGSAACVWITRTAVAVFSGARLCSPRRLVANLAVRAAVRVVRAPELPNSRGPTSDGSWRSLERGRIGLTDAICRSSPGWAPALAGTARRRSVNDRARLPA